MKIATVGTFDGVHRGHEAVLHTLRREGDRRNLSPLVLTFTNHPLEIVAPQRAPKALMLPYDKRAAIEKEGVEVEMLTFDPSLCSLTAAQWLASLRSDYDVKALVLGYDNTFGSDGRFISREDYHRLGLDAGLTIIDAPQLPGCSSSAARRAVADGNISLASSILGRNYSLTGSVIHGMALGRELGFPTANLQIDSRLLLPRSGVYAVDVSGIDSQKNYRGVLNIGSRPSIEGRNMGVECHILDWEGNLYGKNIRVNFLARLRDEQKFSSLQKLKAAITNDVANAAKVSENQPLLP